MNFADHAIVFSCAGSDLVGVISRPELPGETGLIVIVGGPQYRIGSHRQFVHLARHAAAAGVTTLRFDYRGMGDSFGTSASFENVDADIGAAIDALVRHCSSVRRIFLWGLCDGASAALMYLQRTGDQRVAGVCILNPWVRSAATLARTQVKHYYGQRMLQVEFWRKLLRGGIDVVGSLRELGGVLRSAAMERKVRRHDLPFQARMAAGLKAFTGSVLLVLSERDLTAKEFVDFAASEPAWAASLNSSRLTRCEIAESDHTFSSQFWRERVEEATVQWILMANERRP